MVRLPTDLGPTETAAVRNSAPSPQPWCSGALGQVWGVPGSVTAFPAFWESEHLEFDSLSLGVGSAQLSSAFWRSSGGRASGSAVSNSGRDENTGAKGTRRPAHACERGEEAL